MNSSFVLNLLLQNYWVWKKFSNRHYRGVKRLKTSTIAIVTISVIIIAVGTFLISSSLHGHTGNSPQSVQANYLLDISNGTLQIPDRSYTFYPFSAPQDSSNAQVNGNFSMQGNGSSIRVLILDDKNFANWKDGRQINSYYSSTQLTGTIQVSIPSGEKLYLVYDNTPSKVSSMTISSRISFTYTSYNSGNNFVFKTLG